MKKIDVQKCIDKIKSNDHMTYEDGFHEMIPIVLDHKNLIIDTMLSENDPEIRARFIELIGLCKDPTLIPLLKNELESQDDEVINWTLTALEIIDCRESIQIAKSYRINNPRWSE